MPFPLTRLRQLREEGLIHLRSKILAILDFAGLSRLAQYEPSYLHLMRTQRADPAVAEHVGGLVPPTC